MLDHLENKIGKTKTSSLLFFIVSIATVTIPDWDLIFQGILLHRSILFHSILIPFLIDYFHNKYSSKKYPVIIAAIYFSFTVHLSADLFPKSWQGFALISIPFIGWIGILSPVWIFGNILAGSYFCLKTIKQNNLSFYPYHFYLTALIFIILYFLKGESFLMIPVTILSIDYFGKKYLFSYFRNRSGKQINDIKEKASDLTIKTNESFKEIKKSSSNLIYSFFRVIFNFFKIIFYAIIGIAFLGLIILGFYKGTNYYQNDLRFLLNDYEYVKYENIFYNDKPIPDYFYKYILWEDSGMMPINEEFQKCKSEPRIYNIGCFLDLHNSGVPYANEREFYDCEWTFGGYSLPVKYKQYYLIDVSETPCGSMKTYWHTAYLIQYDGQNINILQNNHSRFGTGPIKMFKIEGNGIRFTTDSCWSPEQNSCFSLEDDEYFFKFNH